MWTPRLWMLRLNPHQNHADQRLCLRRFSRCGMLRIKRVIGSKRPRWRTIEHRRFSYHKYRPDSCITERSAGVEPSCTKSVRNACTGDRRGCAGMVVEDNSPMFIGRVDHARRVTPGSPPHHVLLLLRAAIILGHEVESARRLAASCRCGCRSPAWEEYACDARQDGVFDAHSSSSVV